MSKAQQLHTIELATKEGGKIMIDRLEEPYGEGSEAVLSIGVSLNGNEPDWKVHIPYENVDELIEALTKAKNG